jgi:hypothetical protein
VKLRGEIARFLPGCRLLPPTSMGCEAIARLKAGPRTRLAEGEDFLAAYHELQRKVIG